MFNPDRLKIAKKRRQLTSKALAERSGLAQETISRIEKGIHCPDPETVVRIAGATEYPEEFFFMGEVDNLDASAVSFRSLARMSARQRDAALGAGVLGVEFNLWIEQQFEVPEANIPETITNANAETAAFELRLFWGIGDKPIRDVTNLLESNGVRVMSLSEDTANVDAFSFWRDGRPYVFLNTMKTAERSVFDMAHELGHLILHRGDADANLGDETKLVEREADAFASAFLMPKHDVMAVFSQGYVSSEMIIEAKHRWKVSAMALARRLSQIGLLSEWRYRAICKQLAISGYRSSEPIGLPRETSTFWKSVGEMLWHDGISPDNISRRLHIPVDELNSLLAGMNPAPKPPKVTGGKPVLRLVS